MGPDDEVLFGSLNHPGASVCWRHHGAERGYAVREFEFPLDRVPELSSGDVLAIYQRGAVSRDRIANELIRMPSERAGLLMVFRSFDKLSYGLVLQTERVLAVGDEVRNP